MKVKPGSGIDGISCGTCLRRGRWVDLSLRTPFTLCCVCASSPEPSLVFILTQTHCKGHGIILCFATISVFSVCILCPSLLILFYWLKLEILEVLRFICGGF